jgi:hypothetical protein
LNRIALDWMKLDLRTFGIPQEIVFVNGCGFVNGRGASAPLLQRAGEMKLGQGHVIMRSLRVKVRVRV